jgi:hypothetical protein
MSTDALQVSIEQRLEEISEEIERLRAALDALGPGDTSRPSGSRPPRRVRRTAARHAVLVAPADRQALSAGDVATARRVKRSTIPAALPRLDGDGPSLAGARSEGLAHEPTGAAAAATPTGELATPVTGADRAVQSLRRELAAGLRNGRG